VQQAVGTFLQTVLPSGVVIIEGQDSSVPEPVGVNYVVMTPLVRSRLVTNLDLYADVEMTASIAGGVLTVTAVRFGVILVASQPKVWGVNGDVPDGTFILEQLTGAPGGIGTYQLNSFTLSASGETMACGNMFMTDCVDLTMQLDVHSNNVRDGSDIASTITAVLRDGVAADFFDYDTTYQGITPLYADEARQVPFQNAEQNWESRWVVDAHFQVNVVLTVPMQFATAAQITIHPVQ
jgi:hypothetical protein